MFSTVFIALLLSCCLSLASVIPLERRTTGVITQCTEPNTVALTFVRSCLPPLSMRLTSKKNFLASFLQDDGPYIYLYDILLHVITTRCVLKSCIFRQDVVDTLKKANAKGTFFFSSWSVTALFHCSFPLSEFFFFFSLSDLDGHNCSFIPPVLEYHW